MKKILMAMLLMVATVAGAQQTYKLENNNGQYISTGATAIGKQDKAIFGGAILWALDQAGANEKAKNAIESYDAGTLTLRLKPSTTAGDYIYTFQLALQAQGSKLHFLIENIRCTPKGALGVFSAVNFNKINLTKKPQQKELIDRFDALIDGYINQMAAEIKTKDMNLAHWEAITNGQIVKGMTPNECLAAMGKPANITENPQRTQWMYDSGMIVVFENGKVSAVVK